MRESESIKLGFSSFELRGSEISRRLGWKAYSGTSPCDFQMSPLNVRHWECTCLESKEPTQGVSYVVDFMLT